ncbi:MAG: zinc ribbon domain-containing protein [Oscillospiraceae bacterium]
MRNCANSSRFARSAVRGRTNRLRLRPHPYSEQPPRCPSCGAQLRKRQPFCPFCGVRIDEAGPACACAGAAA